MPPPPGGSSAITTEELRRLLATVRAHNRAAAASAPKVVPQEEEEDEESAPRPAPVALRPSPWRQPRRAETTLKLPNGDVYRGEVLILGDGQPPQLHGRGTYACADGSRYEGGYRFGAREGEGEWRAATAASAAATVPATAKAGGSAAASAATPSPPVSVRYRGAWVADSPDGAGEAWYSDGALYAGDWERGRRQGWGKLTRPAAGGGGGGGGPGGSKGGGSKGGSKGAADALRAAVFVVYEGEWRDDAPHGRGRWAFEDGSGFFEGVFERGARSRGRLVALLPAPVKGAGAAAAAAAADKPSSSSASVDFDYTGPLHPDDGTRHGDDGACVCPGRWEYRGPWRRGARHGPGGRCRFAADGGSVYEGAWSDDLPHGEGAWREANGDAYAGAFVRGLREGRGVWRSSGGEERYAGGWRGGERDGRGECRYADGGRYAGEWRRGKRHGRGRMRFPDGAVFDGAWEDDGWVQGAADPRFCRIRGLRRAVAATADGGPAPSTAAAAAGGQEGRKEGEDEPASSFSSSPGWFVIVARDELGNARLSGGDSFSVVVEGPLLPAPAAATAGDDAAASAAAAAAHATAPAARAHAADVLDAGDGTYRARLPPAVLRAAGEYRVHVTDALTGEVVAGAPLPLTVAQGPADARRCRALLSAAPSSFLSLRPGGMVEARVDAFDALGNATGGGGQGAGGGEAPFSVDAALVWRGPLAGAARFGPPQEGACTSCARVAFVVEPDDRGWAVRGSAPAACGEYLLEIVRRRRAGAAGAGVGGTGAARAGAAEGKEVSSHLPGSPFLVVVVAAEAEEGVGLTAQPRAVATDEARAWAARAAAADAEEGDGGEEATAAATDGSGGGAALPPGASESERAFIARNPLVPVVENLRDLHLVSRVQAMREDRRSR